MQETVYRVIEVLCAVVARDADRDESGAGAPAVDAGERPVAGDAGSGDPRAECDGVVRVRRCVGRGRRWGRGTGASAGLLGRWRRHVEQAGVWRAHEHEGYRPVAVDVTGFWRPRLQGCATSHYHGPAGKALPAIPVGIVARVGSVGTQRLGLPLAFVRADDGRSEHGGARAGVGAGGRGGHGRHGRAGARRRLRDPAAAGGQGDAVRRAGGEERHRPTGGPASLSGAGASAHPGRADPPARAHLSGPGAGRDATGSDRDLAGGRRGHPCRVVG